jgi:hypothetical protein
MGDGDKKEKGSGNWMADETKPVDLNLHGMVDYAKSMVTISENLNTLQGRAFSQIRALVKPSFPPGLAEVNLASAHHGQNLEEFGKYIGFLNYALQNIGNAAQTVADSYDSADGWGAADLGAINFAFGVYGAKRPSGLPPGLGKTFYDAYIDAQQKAAAQAAQGGGADSDHDWKVTSSNTDPITGAGTITMTDQYGKTKTIQVTVDGGTKTTVTTGPDGKATKVIESSYSYPYGTVTNVTTVGPDGKTSHSQTTTSSVGTTSTTSHYGDNGKVTNTSTTQYNADGSQTVTERSYDESGTSTITSQYTVAQDSYQPGTDVDDPGADAQKEFKQQMPQDHTVTLAPGEFGDGHQSSSSGTASV